MTDGLSGAHSPPSLAHRRRWIERFRLSVLDRLEPLVDLVEDEVGKPRHEIVTTEILPLVASCRWHERNLDRLLRPRGLGLGAWWLTGQRHREHREPLGRVAIIATWNYPVQLLGIQLLQAIAAGNEVVVKPSERAPRTQEYLLWLARDAGLSERQLTWIDATRAAGEALLMTERFDHILFTGSTEVGRDIARLGATTLTPTTLELSGQDSAFVLEDCDAALAAKAIWNAVTMNAGQTCMAPRRALVEVGAYGAFLAALAPLAAAARGVNLIDEGAATRCHELSRSAHDAGARSLSGVLEAPEGRRFRPLAMVDCPESAALVDGDHFGPVLAVVPIASVKAGLTIHHRVGKHLATSIFTRSRHRVEELRRLLGSSLITVNDAVVPSAHPGASIGGRGESGWGVSRGREGLLALTRAVVVSRTPSLLRLPTDPPTSAALSTLIRVARFLDGGGDGRRNGRRDQGLDVRGKSTPAMSEAPASSATAAQSTSEQPAGAARPGATESRNRQPQDNSTRGGA